MGVTAEQYWDGDFTLLSAYKDSYRFSLQQQTEFENWKAWINGRYVYEGLCTALSGVFSKNSKLTYPDRPHEMKARDEKVDVKSKEEKQSEFYAKWDKLASESEGKGGIECLKQLMQLR